MKYGMNMLLWATAVDETHDGLLEQLKEIVRIAGREGIGGQASGNLVEIEELRRMKEK